MVWVPRSLDCIPLSISVCFCPCLCDLVAVVFLTGTQDAGRRTQDAGRTCVRLQSKVIRVMVHRVSLLNAKESLLPWSRNFSSQEKWHSWLMTESVGESDVTYLKSLWKKIVWRDSDNKVCSGDAPCLCWLNLSVFLCFCVIVDVFLVVSVWCCWEWKNHVENRQCLSQIVLSKTRKTTTRRKTCASNGLRPSSRCSLCVSWLEVGYWSGSKQALLVPACQSGSSAGNPVQSGENSIEMGVFAR